MRLCKEIVRKKLRNIGGRILSPNIPQMENGYPPNLKNMQQEILKSKMNLPQNKIWGMQLKRRRYRAVKNYWKASKIEGTEKVLLCDNLIQYIVV